MIRWSMENIHPYYFYGDDVAHLEINNDDPNGFWDCMVNVLESYRVCVEDMVRDLEQLYTDTMTAFAIRSLMEGKAADAQRIYDGVCVPEQENLLREWYRTDSAHRPLVLQRFVEKISKLNMGLEYGSRHRADSASAFRQIRGGRSLFRSCQIYGSECQRPR